MTSLSDTYGSGPVGAAWSRRQLILGVTLFAAGGLMLILGILAATTNLFVGPLVESSIHSLELAGVLAGLGVPMVMVGILSIVPSTPRQRLGAFVGLGIAAVGVLVFTQAYPHHWNGYGNDYTLQVSVIYFLGLFTTLGFLFYAVANFKTRNDPGGTVKLQLNIEGEQREVEVDRDQLRNGGSGMGVLGSSVLDDHVQTQTNRPEHKRSD